MVDGFDERQRLTHRMAEVDPVSVVTKRNCHEAFEYCVGVSAERQGDLRMALGQLRLVAVHLNDFAGRHKLLPVESALLQRQPRTQRDQQVGLLQQDVAVAHAPGVRAAEVHRMLRAQAIHGVPRQHYRHARGGKLHLQPGGGRTVDARTQQQHRALRHLDALDKAGNRYGIEGLKLWRKRWHRSVECGLLNLRALNVEWKLEEDGPFAAMGAGANKRCERRLVDNFFNQLRALGDGSRDRHTVDLLDAALSHLRPRQVRHLHLPADHQ